MPLGLTLDTNLFYDKALGREGAADFDAILELACAGKVQLFSTATTDFEDSSGAATRVVLRLMSEGLVQEACNAGTLREYMPGNPGLHCVDEDQCSELLSLIWPDENWRGASDNKRNDVYHLLAHMLNGHDVYITRDKEILGRRKSLERLFGITVMSPKDLIDVLA